MCQGHWREKFITVGLSKYMDFLKVGIAQSSTYEMKMKPYAKYWEDILLHGCVLNIHESLLPHHSAMPTFNPIQLLAPLEPIVIINFNLHMVSPFKMMLFLI
jgi:hypothetical protein